MPKDIQTSIAGRTLSLSNLDKVLFEKDNIVKAELIAYYMDVHEKVLSAIKGRPATLIRYPDGALSKSFYSKNMPEWAPQWIPYATLSETDDNRYILINDLPTLIWVANLAALEIHTIQSTISNLDMPDQFIFDLDPPDEEDFEKVKEIALNCHDFLAKEGYHPYLKTSGSKGIHLCVPIHPAYETSKVMDQVKLLAAAFVKQNSDTTTLAIAKDKRGGKVLIDILRNHASSTCVAAFSTRGRTEGSISMPVSPELLKEIDSSKFFTLSNYKQYIDGAWAYWQSFNAMATDLYPKKSGGKLTSELTPIKALVDSTNLEENITPAALAEYSKKRDFQKTSEPKPSTGGSTNEKGNRYCLQLHDATNLHYDLRLEHNGTLMSWAIPKGLPISKDQKRLAIRTEDHPLKYLTFEGEIPKGEYGGGTMWLLQQGEYDIEKMEDKDIKFSISQNANKIRYHLFHTKENQWLCQRMVEGDSLPIMDPMLAILATEMPDANDYFFEVKWDGIRAQIHKNGDEVRIISRGGNDIAAQFPELVKSALDIDVAYAILDCEIVVLDALGKPIFKDVISRLHSKVVPQSAKPAIAYCFDLLWMDGWNMTNFSNVKRKEIAAVIIKSCSAIRDSNPFADGHGLLQAITANNMEGIIAKRKNASYVSGKRGTDWLKIKVNNTEEVVIIGYTSGEGERADLLGALHVAALNDDGSLTYMGKVGTGFNAQSLVEITQKLKSLPQVPKPIPDKIEDERSTSWVSPELKCMVKYASITNTGMLREPVFLMMNV